ncbi:MAG: T9SS type A sorting domain-containing protein [candidate division Zixibacteria bacterium]|nr:T9SS type A sorting domain-containing protein [candidate division Zixibacteria bacterium]
MSAFAQKDINDTKALGTFCASCEFSLTDDSTYFYGQSTHAFQFDSDSKQVTRLEVSFKVSTTGAVTYDINPVYTGYGSLDTTSIATDSATWINVVIDSVGGTVFNGETVFELLVSTDECLPIGDSILIDVGDLADSSYYSLFFVAGEPNQPYTPVKIDGFSKMYDPEAVVSVIGVPDDPDLPDSCSGQYPGDVNGDEDIDIGDLVALSNLLTFNMSFPHPLQNADPNGDCIVNWDDYYYLNDILFVYGDPPVDCSCEEMMQLVDSNVLGGSVSVPLYLRHIDFDYRHAYDFTLYHPPALTYTSVDTTGYSGDVTVYQPTDSTLQFFFSGGEITHPPDSLLPLQFLTVNFVIDSNLADTGTYYNLMVDGDYIFAGCQDYADTGNGDIAMVWVKATADSTRCYDCAVDIADASIYYEVDANGFKESSHLFTFDSDGLSVSEIEVTLKVGSDDDVQFSIVDKGYELPDTAWYDDGSDFWINLTWSGIADSVFDGDELFELKLYTAECVAPADSIAIEIIGNGAQGFENQFKETGTAYYKSLGNLATGYMMMYNPDVQLSVMGYDEPLVAADSCEGQMLGDVLQDSVLNLLDMTRLISILVQGHYEYLPDPIQNADANGDCIINMDDFQYLDNYIYYGGPPPPDCSCDDMPQVIDSNIVGEQVTVPVYFRDINLDYKGVTAFYLFFDDALNWVGWDSTTYSSDFQVYHGDTSAVFVYYGDTKQRPPDDSLPALLATVTFTIDSTKTQAGDYLRVNVWDGYQFTGCANYVATDTGDIAIAWVKVLHDSSICYDCQMALANDTIYYDVDADEMKESKHLFTFDSEGQQVDDIDITLKVSTVGNIAYSITDKGFGLPDTASVDLGSEVWINLSWTDIGDSVFVGAELFELSLMTGQCLAASDSLAIEITNNDSLGYYNRFKASSGAYWRYPVDFGYAFVYMFDPLVHVSLWATDSLDSPPDSCEGQNPGDADGDGEFSISDVTRLIAFTLQGRYDLAPEPFQNGDPNGDCIVDPDDIQYLIEAIYIEGPPPVDCSCDDMPQILDSNFVGETVAVPVYFRDVNFDYRDGDTVRVKFSAALQYDSITTNDISTGMTTANVTDTSIQFILNANTIDKPAADSLPTTFFTIYFTLDSAETRPGGLYEVAIAGEYTFMACDAYGASGTDDIPTVWVKAVWDMTKYCPYCGVYATDDSIYYEVDQDGLKESSHLLTLQSDGNQVEDIEVTVFVNSTDVVDVSTVDRGFGAPAVDTLSDSLGFWINMTWSDVGDTVFAGENLVELVLYTAACVAPGDSLVFEVSERPASNYFTQYKETGTGYTRHIVNRGPGYAILLEPELSVSLIGSGEVPGQIVDSSLGSTPVSVPIHLHDINYDYSDFSVYVKWESGLDYDSVQYTNYATGNATEQTGDSIIVADTSGLFQHPESMPEVLATIWFTIDTLTTEPGDMFRVEMYSPYTFDGCPTYTDTGDITDEYVYIRYSDSGICLDCEYALSDSGLEYSYGVGYVDFKPIFSFNSDSKPVDKIELTFKVHSTDVYFVTIDDTLITGFQTLERSWHKDSPYVWCHVEIDGLDGAVFDNEPLLEFLIRTSECRPAFDTLLVEFASLEDSGYYNQFVDTGGNTKTFLDEDMNDGNFWYVEPVVEITALPHPDSAGMVLDSGYVGGYASMPVYLKDLTFDYVNGFGFTVGHDPALTYHSIIQTDYSSGNLRFTEATDQTDSTVRLEYVGDWGSYHSAPPYEVLLWVTFYFDPNLTIPDSCYKVWLDGDYIFNGCADLADTGTAVDDWGYLKTVKQVASLKFGSLSMLKSTSGGKLYVYLKNTAPVLTDLVTDFCGIRFAFDTASLNYCSYAGFSTAYPYQGDTLFWEDETIEGCEDTIAFDENRLSQSTAILPSYIYQKIGYLTINAGGTIGNDTPDFVRFADTPYCAQNNFLVFKYTNDTIRYVDSVVNDSAYYGDLDLGAGSISITDDGGDPIGCPMLYVWDGSNYVMDDFILTQSHGNLNPEPVDDYYPLKLGVIDENGFYRLMVREFEKEITYLDQMELIAVDYPQGSRVGISNEGEVYTYSESSLPVAAVDELGNDVLPYISAKDGVWFEKFGPGSLTLTFTNPTTGKDSRGMALDLDEGGEIKKDVSGTKEAGGHSERPNLIAAIEDASGNWHDLGVVPPRQYLSENCSFFFNSAGVEMGETFRVKVSWQNNFRADIQRLHIDDGSEFVRRELSPRYARHSAHGKVLQKLTIVDDDVITIRPGEDVELKFSVPETVVKENYARRYFLRSNGYFRTMEPSDLLPKDFVLYHNYPNPFNPSTTIKLSVPTDCDISLVVYNVLGQEVKTLYDGRIDAGTHDIVWNGDNNNHARVASGVYFYRLRSGDFDRSRKMTLLK